MKLGFIGLGAMGTPMALNLIKAGHELRVWNRTPERTGTVAEAGAHRADSPAEAAEGVEAVIIMVADTKAVEEVLFGEEGILQGLPEGAAVIDMSTISAADSRRITEILRERGYRMMDAPVAGSTPVAEAGELTILAGGDQDLFEEFRPVLEAMGEKIFHMGPAGSGSHMKLVNNLILGGTMAVIAEGLALGERAGLSAESQLEVLAPASPVAKMKGPKITSRAYAPQFRLSHMLKDLYYALELGRELQHALPVTGLVSQVYNAGMKDHAEEDFSAVTEVPRKTGA